MKKTQKQKKTFRVALECVAWIGGGVAVGPGKFQWPKFMNKEKKTPLLTLVLVRELVVVGQGWHRNFREGSGKEKGKRGDRGATKKG